MELDLVEQMNNMALSEASGVKDVEVGDLSLMLNIDSASTKVLVGLLYRLMLLCHLMHGIVSVFIQSSWKFCVLCKCQDG